MAVAFPALNLDGMLNVAFGGSRLSFRLLDHISDVTGCIVAELDTLGPAFYGTAGLANSFRRIRCGHDDDPVREGGVLLMARCFDGDGRSALTPHPPPFVRKCPHRFPPANA